MTAFLETLVDKKVFLFGTAGFGGTPSYFEDILKRVRSHLGDNNRILGSYLYQRKMQLAVRARYETLALTDPDKANPMLANFDRALSHPDEADLQRLRDVIATLSEC